MVNIYKRFWHVNWAQQWQYRANLLMYLAYWIVSPITISRSGPTIANDQGSVNGMTAADFAAYYLTLLPVDILTSSITIYYLATKMQDGTLSNDLIQPVHPDSDQHVRQQHCLQGLADDGVYSRFGSCWCFCFNPNLTYTWQSILLAIPAIALGFFIRFLMESTITLMAFWTTRVWAIYNFDIASRRC